MEPKIKFTSSSMSLPLGRFAGSLGLATVVAVLLVVIVVMGRQFITTEWDSYQKSQADKKVYEKKKDTLSSVSPSVFDRSGPSALAMPEKNPLLWSISQIKSYLSQNEDLTITSFKAESEGTSLPEITSLQYSIDIEATDIQSIIGLMDHIQSISPITRINNVKTEITTAGVKSKITLSVFWSPYPTKLSDISEPIVSINEQETEILNVIASLKQPAFSVLSPSAPSIRENPFN